jgi:hypothetical protein
VKDEDAIARASQSRRRARRSILSWIDDPLS